MTQPDFDAELPVPPACRPTVERLQLVLDGESPAAAIDADPHAAACAACRGRIAAAREIPVPPGLTDAILSAVHEDRYARIRRRSYAWTIGIGVAVAASLLLVGWLTRTPPQPLVPLPFVPAPDTTHVAPEPRPVRIGDEFSKLGVALRGSSKPITEPAAAAPQMFGQLTDALTRPVAPAAEFEPARRSLAELPDAARAGLEPVTGTAQKAFSRLLRDVGAVQVNKPKS